MLPLEQNTVSALLAKFIAARVFIIIMFSAFLWILLHLIFALHLTYISQYLLFSFQLQEGSETFAEILNISILITAFFPSSYYNNFLKDFLFGRNI